jgi:hypothetical protein
MAQKFNNNQNAATAQTVVNVLVDQPKTEVVTKAEDVKEKAKRLALYGLMNIKNNKRVSFVLEYKKHNISDPSDKRWWDPEIIWKAFVSTSCSLYKKDGKNYSLTEKGEEILSKSGVSTIDVNDINQIVNTYDRKVLLKEIKEYLASHK